MAIEGMAMMQADLFEARDLTEGRRRRDDGVRRVVCANVGAVAKIREYLKSLGRPVHVDDARHFVRFAGLCLTSGNVYGAIFRERGWQQTGEWRASEFPGNHGHKSPLWEWKP